VLAVVEYQQYLLVAQVGEQKVPRLGGLVPQVESGDQGAAHQRGVDDLGEFDDPAAVSEGASQVGHCPDGEPGLADAARADEADQARVGELALDLG